MSELIEEYFCDQTIKTARERLLIKKDAKGTWQHYSISLEVDESPDVCEPRTLDESKFCIGCGNDFPHANDICECWRCDERIDEDGDLLPAVFIWAERIDDADDRLCVNEEFCYWKEIMDMREEAVKVYGEEVYVHTARHASGDMFGRARELEHAGILVDRTGWVLSIPKPTPSVLTGDTFIDHGL